MTTTLQAAMREIQEEMILTIRNPSPCEALGCRAYGRRASTGPTYCEAHSPGQCLYEGCSTRTMIRDSYGLCPQHAVTATTGLAPSARREMTRTYGPPTVPANPRPQEARIPVTRGELMAAHDMLNDLSGKDRARLLGEKRWYPSGPRWKAHGDREPRYMAAVARAVARGSYCLKENA